MNAPAKSEMSAKDQVRIKARIWKARHDFVGKNQVAPKCLYLGHDDYRDLLRELEPWEMPPMQNRRSFMGMDLYLVDDERHINVA